MLCYYGDDMEEYRRWQDNIKMDLKEIGVDVMDWINLTRDMYHWSILNPSVLQAVTFLLEAS